MENKRPLGKLKLNWTFARPDKGVDAAVGVVVVVGLICPYSKLDFNNTNSIINPQTIICSLFDEKIKHL